MTPQRHRRLMELFDHACELPRREALAFVEALSADDADVREALVAMLEVDQRSHGQAEPSQSGAPCCWRALSSSAH